MLTRLLSAPLIAVLPWAIGQWLRDRWWLTGLFFYIPSPLLWAALVFAALGLWARKQRRTAAATLLASLLPAAMTLGVENRWAEPPAGPATPPAHEVTLAHWNVFRGWLGWDRVQQRLAEQAADIYVLSELPQSIGSRHVAWFGEGFSMVRNYNLGLACRGFAHGRTERPRSELRLLYAVCQVGEQEVGILAVDLPSSLWLPRQPLLRELDGWIRHFRPDVTVGDFNAPRRSLQLTALPPGFEHAYRGAGHGWSYSWPVPLPVLAIDHCILGPRVRASHYRLESTGLSDHRIQTLRFSLARGPD